MTIARMRPKSKGSDCSAAGAHRTIARKTNEGTANAIAALAALAAASRVQFFMDWLNLIQWPAMAVTVLAAWLVASAHKPRREIGFWVFLVSNAPWIAWAGTAAPGP